MLCPSFSICSYFLKVVKKSSFQFRSNTKMCCGRKQVRPYSMFSIVILLVFVVYYCDIHLHTNRKVFFKYSAAQRTSRGVEESNLREINILFHWLACVFRAFSNFLRLDHYEKRVWILLDWNLRLQGKIEDVATMIRMKKVNKICIRSKRINSMYSYSFDTLPKQNYHISEKF